MGSSVDIYGKLQMEAYWSNPKTVPKCVPGPKSSFAHTALPTSTTPSVDPDLDILLKAKVPLDGNEAKKHVSNEVEWTDWPVASLWS